MRPPLSKDVWYTDDEDVIQKHSFKQWNGREKRFLIDILSFILFSCLFTHSFSFYFFDYEFYTDVQNLNEEENGGVGVVLGTKVYININFIKYKLFSIFNFLFSSVFLLKNTNRLLN